MKTAKEILDSAIQRHYDSTEMHFFEDIPMQVFYNAMEEYATQSQKKAAVVAEDEEDAEFCPSCGSNHIYCIGGEFNDWSCNTCSSDFSKPKTK